MLEISRETVRGVPVLILTGRLDSNGASLFDQEAGALVDANPHIVLDLSQVEYLSSLGIRSLLTLEKGLKSGSGGLILTGLNPFVSQVLELSGLLNRFLIKESVEQAVGTALELGAHEDMGEMSFGGRAYRVTRRTGTDSAMDVWGAPGETQSGPLKDRLISVSMEDLGFCFGLGGFGHTRDQAAECPGLFVSAGRLTGLMPADIHGAADFMVVERPAESFVYVASGLGFSGEPLFFMESLDHEEHPLEEILEDALEGADRFGAPDVPVLGIVLVAEGPVITGSRYRDVVHILENRPDPMELEGGKGILLVGAVTRTAEAHETNDARMRGVVTDLEAHPFGPGVGFMGHGIGMAGDRVGEGGSSLQEEIRELADLEQVRTVFRVDPSTRVRHPRVWVFRPSRIRSGEEKLLRVAVEGGEPFGEAWEMITRRLYSDAGRVVIRPLHGGYMATTFAVDSYDREGRRWIPTVLKIAPAHVSRREEDAFHRYVEKTILNNSTSIQGTAGHGEWVGLRYNFVGIGGADSRLTWLADHVRARPAGELIPIFNRLFTGVLKPWYGQPRWENTYLYEEHDPRPLFPRISEDAREALNIQPDDETIPCDPLGETLPNPYRFLEKEFSRRRREARLWYRSICHGDLNMQNILLDERDNIYVIDYSETGLRNVVSDFARMEAILKIEMTRLDDENDLERLVRFDQGLSEATALDRVAPFHYDGTDPMVAKVYDLITLLRSLADRATLFETDMIPYWLALLQWTLPVVSYSNAGALRKRFATWSAGLLVQNIMACQGGTCA